MLHPTLYHIFPCSVQNELRAILHFSKLRDYETSEGKPNYKQQRYITAIAKVSCQNRLQHEN